MGVTTIYKITNGRISYAFKTSIKNNHTIRLIYSDEDGEFSINSYDLNDDLYDVIKEMRDDFKAFIDEDNLCRKMYHKYLIKDFSLFMGNVLNEKKMDTSYIINANDIEWLKALKETYINKGDANE